MIYRNYRLFILDGKISYKISLKFNNKQDNCNKITVSKFLRNSKKLTTILKLVLIFDTSDQSIIKGLR